MKNSENILLKTFDITPFDLIQDSDYQKAIEHAIAEARLEIDQITNSTEPPTFTNTIAALDYAGYKLDRVSSVFFNINSAETNDAIQKTAQEVSPLLSEFSNDITLNETLFKRVKQVYDVRETLELTREEQVLLEKKYKGFARNGANLPEDKKARLREIDTKLSKLALTFGENILAETNKYELHITNEADLAGLPESTKEAA
ncbi:MAG: M3 family peptidase, partial [Leeuwenhoekiella sp.]|nr:M3 family peptidase [Leeuwenhoekiella sp.]